MNIHRVRLSDGDIRRIARALKWFTDLINEKGLLELQDRMEFERLHRRFDDWGLKDEFREGRMFRRTHRRAEGTARV